MRLARVWLCAFVLAGCSGPAPGDEAAVHAVADQRCQAIVSRDPARYRALLSPAYNDHGKDYAAKVSELAATLRTQEIIDFSTTDRRVSVTGTQAVLRQRYRLRVISKGNRYAFQGEETIRLRKEADGWKISGGL